MIGSAKLPVERYFGEQRRRGGIEPQRLMSRSLGWQTVSSAHWEHPPDTDLPRINLIGRLR